MTLESTAAGFAATCLPDAAIARDAHSDAASDSDAICNGTNTNGSNDQSDADRAIAPIGTVLLVAIAVILAAGVGTATFGGAPLQEPAPTASLSLSADGDELTVRHLAGDSLDAHELRLEVTVDGDPLAHQPPVPFFSATGFRPGPTGAFNVAGDTTISPGETASFRIAGTNSPLPSAGDRVTVTVYSEGYRIAQLTARVR